MILLPVWWHKFFQTRVDQITQQLKSGILEIGDNDNSVIAAHSPDHEASSHQIDNEVNIIVSDLLSRLSS